MIAVERVRAPSPAEFEAHFVKRSRPVILTGVIDDWPAMESWSCNYFKTRFGDRMVPVIGSKQGAMYDAQSGVHYDQIRVREYIDLLATGERTDLYMVFRVHEVMPELFEDIVYPSYCRDSRWRRSRFFLGAPDNKVVFHRDLPQNLYAQIVGRKKFLLLDRRCTRMVHRHSFASGVPNFSPVDAEAPDLERHPRFRDAPLMVATVEPGELLYIPSLWWHQTRSLDVTAAVNLWWAAGPLLVAVRAAELFMRIRRLRL